MTGEGQLDEAGAALLRMAAGDRSAVGELYDLLGAAVYGTIRRVVRDPARSEELTQEVFVTCWRAADRFDAARGTAKAWVLTVAHRRAVDCVRSEERRRVREERDAQSVRVEPDGPADLVIGQVERSLVADALAVLSAAQREAIELAYYEGRTQREIAELLDVPLGTIKTRIRDGLLRLRREIEVER